MNKPRHSGNRNAPPQRVTYAAEQMRNPSGFSRGYVPQPTGSQRPIHQPDSGQNSQNAPVQYGNGGQRGFGVPTRMQQKPKKKKKIWLFLTVIAAVVLIAGAVYAGVQISRDAAEKKRISDKVSPYNGLYCPGVYVDGIHLGGMTPDQAMNSVQSQINQRQDAWKVKLVYQGNVVADITTDTLNMKIDQNQLIEVMNGAWKPGHTGTEAERESQMDLLLQKPYEAYTARPSGNTGEINRILQNLKNQIDTPAVNATVQAFDVSRAFPFVFTDEITGRSLDIEPVIDHLYQMVSTMSSGTVELVPEIIQPTVTRADLENQYSLIGSATTPIDRHSTDNRNNNIRRCFQAFNGYVLQPGKTFSFNKVVGERTLLNGFFEAPEYINDEHVIGVGGGACQASTTLYQAAVRAGMEITARRPHSDSVSYADYGMDATVYMGGKQIDLTFKNTSSEPVYITAEVIKNNNYQAPYLAKVNIYGRSLGNIQYDIVVETVEVLPSLLPPVYVSDKENASKAKDGCIVNSYRVTYVDGVLSDEKKLLFTDKYTPKPEKIYDPNLASGS